MSITARILVIDDELSVRQTLARILQRAGYDVTTAEDGGQALDFLKTTAFDLVYLDIRMPGLSGLELLDHIHAADAGLPVVLFTAQPDLGSAVEALRRGANDYLLKPIKPELLLERTAGILALRQKDLRRREILAQMETLREELNRLGGESSAQPAAPVPVDLQAADRFVKCGSLVLDTYTRHLTVAGREVSLPPTSFDYLLVLARHAPQVVQYQALVAEAQGYQADLREAQELSKWHIHHIRQAIEADARNPSYLINVRGTGYRLVAG